MNCESAKDLMWLAECGELNLDDEDLLERHIAECRTCAAERQRMQRIDALLQTQRMDVSPQLLARCRRDLSEKIGAERVPSGVARWRAFLRSAWTTPWLRPAGAVALVAIGFLGGRAFTPAARVPVFVASNSTPSGLAGVVAQHGAPQEESAALDNASYEEPRAHVASGAYANDARLRGVLLAAVSAQDPALRLDSIELLRRHCEDAAVRQALLGALRNDRSSGVRLKALEALKPYARDTETRSVLAQVLLTDNNPTVRTQAIELLTQSHSPDVAAALQEVLRHEENGYIRERSVTALRAMKASTGTF